MRLGLHIGYWGLGLSADEQLRLVREAESLGFGSSGPQVAEGWHGQPFAKQLQRTREYVDIVRMALARERVEYHGESYELPIPNGPGKALKLMIGPVQEKIPVYVAAIGPKNTALT